VVDDDPAVLKVLKRALESAGFEVLEAGDGKTAVALMEEKPDLVIQDLILKDITGYDLVSRLRARTEGRKVPFLALSGYMAMPETPWDTSAGFDALLVKPIKSGELVETVRQWLEKGNT
jgi:CheY-like chemotaxis protein